MTTMQTSELIGNALDWAVAKCEGKEEEYLVRRKLYPSMTSSPSNNWSQGGPIIDREDIRVGPVLNIIGNSGTIKAEYWSAEKYKNCEACGQTPLIAAMRCFVASQLGHTVEIPNELVMQEMGVDHKVDRMKSGEASELSIVSSSDKFIDYVNAFAFGNQFSVSDEEIDEVMGGRDLPPVAGALEGKVLALAEFDDVGVVFQSKGRGEARVFLADTLSRVPAVGEMMKVEWKDGKGVVLPLVAEKVLGR